MSDTKAQFSALKQTADPAVADAIQHLIETGADHELNRINVLDFSKRTGLDGVKSVCMALAQSERYGTPLGLSLRVMAQENRDQRMTEAEKKAASLPPLLTVPMVLFFLPVLFIVILGPTYIKISAMW